MSETKAIDMKGASPNSSELGLPHQLIPEIHLTPEISDQEDPSASEPDFYIVGVGASAGGLEALERMFGSMPLDTGMAFVIVQHLSPDFRSLMDELLARHTEMPIYRVEDGMVVEPNSLYLIPPKQEMIISDGKLLLTEKDSKQSLSLPIDHFFRSLAQDAGARSIAVVLSGTGSDGSRGIRDVNKAGGLVIVQSVESAKFDGMPKSAIDTNLVDVVVEPAEIADVLDRYSKHPFRSKLELEKSPPVDETSIESVFRLLQHRHRIDFNYYKPTTIGRRIERRIQLNHRGGDIAEYVRRLEDDPTEVDQLYKDLLIGVTRFFRDRDAFNVLRNDVLPALLLACDPGDEFRVWVAACATGEEAYSIAIMIDECMKEMDRRLAVKIFATDVHQASIDFAHTGIYPETSLDEMTAERRDTYFVRTDAGYQVSPEIRKMIVFASHNLVNDAPFTRLNLITCRNLLIYLRSMAQKKVLSLFHFGLRAGGVVMLGASESPGDLADEFDPINEHWRVFRKRRDVRLPTAIRGTFGFEMAAFQSPTRVSSNTSAIVHDNETIATYSEMLDHFMPPGLLVNENREVIQVFRGAGKYLSFSDGRLSANVLEMVSGDLKLALTGGMQRCGKSGEPVSYDRIRIQTEQGEKHIRLRVSPLRKRSSSNKFLLTFEELDLAEPRESILTESLDLDEVSRGQLGDLEQELRHTKENLQATIEEMETSNEELQATNEELVASNEELQSTNEELHSVNEELFTVNAEYQKKISELTELTNDVNNLLVSTDVHTLFLGPNLCIRKFTPKMAEVFNLVAHDVGRRVDAFAHNITCDDLTAKVTRVLRHGERHEERVQDNQGHRYLMRVLPYRAGEGTSGVVLTLIEISSLVAAQETLIQERERFERAIAANRDGTWDWPDLKSNHMWWSPSCYEILGYEPNEFPAAHSEWMRLIHPEDRARIQETSVPTSRKCYVDEHREFEYRMFHKSGKYRWYCHRAIVDHNEAGEAFRMTGSVTDIHDRKCAEMQNVAAIRHRDNFLSMLSHELRNPMGAVLNAIECLKAVEACKESGTEENELQPTVVSNDVTQIVERQTKHMARLLDDLLDVARFGQGKIEFRKEVIDLGTMVDEIVQSVNFAVKAKDQTLHVTSFDGPLCVYGDPARIKQAQINLLINASKYTLPGGEIWFDLDRENDQVVITVRDSGEGIPKELQESIFDMFVQSETTLARSSGGMGVGLSLARIITEAHEGTIRVQSDGSGHGSTFKIHLPLSEKPPVQKHIAEPVAFDGLKLLLVEDNDDARMMLSETLRLHGFVVAEASDGPSALEQFKKFKPEIALIDIGLPEMDGYQIAATVRKMNGFDKTTLVALTGYARESDRQAAIEAGFDVHLAKPLNPIKLYDQIAAKMPSR